MWYFSDYQGYTNWDTWNTSLMMDNEQELYNAVRKLHARGATPEHIRDWALKHVIGPHNKEAIADAQDWNEIPEDERVDHNYDALREKNEQAADMVDNLGFGRDVSDTEPTLIDPELVNWQEIHQNLSDEADENNKYEREHDRLTGLGLGWVTPGHDDAIQQMRDAMYRYHGALPDNELPGGYKWDHPQAYHRTNVNVPYDRQVQSPDFDLESHMTLDTRNALSKMKWDQGVQKIWDEKSKDPNFADMDPTALWDICEGMFSRIPHDERKTREHDINDPAVQQHLQQDPKWQDFTQNGYNQRLHDYTWGMMHRIHNDQGQPWEHEEMQAALAQRGYPPEQATAMMQPRWRWDPEQQQRIDLRAPTPPPQPDPTLDQPGDLTIPQGWTAGWKWLPVHWAF